MTNTENTIEVETTTTTADEGAVLVVTSKVKKLIKETAGLNTSGDVAAALSSVVAQVIVKAVANAKEAGRKTVMARDVAY